MHIVFDRARLDPKRIVFPEGREKIVRAAKILVAEGICRPVLLGDRATIERLLHEHELSIDVVEVVDPTPTSAPAAMPPVSTRCAGERASPRSPRRR